ncbi:MAG TPA: tyrosine-type recombinase/integrase [Terracidiphilus sp.]|nr:tyrosine-type recombinase/integrase [Terracidiphilus sp.]
MDRPVVTIFVRHSATCKQTDEQYKRCTCRKHFRWSTGQGAQLKQFRQAAGTRSWAEAEQLKRKLEDQLAGECVEPANEPKPIAEAVASFLEEKRVRNISKTVQQTYALELARLQSFCNAAGVYHCQSITRELLTSFCATWPDFYKSSYTRFRVRERLQGFIKFCYDSEWMRRKLPLPQMTIDEPPTMPLTPDEFDRLLAGVNVLDDEVDRKRLRSLFLLMRWTGLAIRDALTIERAEFHKDEAKGIYRVVTERQKTGTHVSVPLHPAIAEEILATPQKTLNARYVFWDGSDGARFANRFYERYVTKAFKAAGIVSLGNMKSHRLRDTFAVDLLEKGVPMEEVSKLLGHESIRTTEKHYAKWVKGRQDRLDTLVMQTWAA